MVETAMGSRIKVLAILDIYLPGFKGGGPTRSLANMVSRLGDRIDFRIVALDRDLGDTKPYPGIRSGRWTKSEASSTFYFSRSYQWPLRFASLIRYLIQQV